MNYEVHLYDRKGFLFMKYHSQGNKKAAEEYCQGILSIPEVTFSHTDTSDNKKTIYIVRSNKQ
ncbi:hypothetical protein CRP7_gp04 [Roseobacter phage CRP-7]|nr:hypothetical protein CRP7_gp04 [Roseobacter phage CRP-7]